MKTNSVAWLPPYGKIGPSYFSRKNREKRTRLPAIPSRILLLGLLLLLSACRGAPSSPTPGPAAAPEASLPTPTITPQAPLGSRQNPILFAFPPLSHPTDQQIREMRQLTDFLSQGSGLILAAVIPASEEELLTGLSEGRYHIAYLSPLLYAALPPTADLQPMLARRQDGKIFYSAQFVVHRQRGLIPFFDPVSGQNTQDAPQALAQLQDRHPCWVSPTSLAGYLIPRAYLLRAGVQPLEAAFLGGHEAVLRALYTPGLCDFGATYTDARAFPSLPADFPDIQDDIQVLWRTPPVIPYDLFVFSRRIPQEQRILFAQRLQSLPFRPEKSILEHLFQVTELELVDESRYREFLDLMHSLPLDLRMLLKLKLP
jgi:ABC-type phosphate/phosphonate transport system substrate-binding protein